MNPALKPGYSRSTGALHSALWFKAADKVVDSLVKRGLVRNVSGAQRAAGIGGGK